MKILIIKFVFLIFVPLNALLASGLDEELYIKKIDIESFENISIKSSLNEFGKIENLEIICNDKNFALGKEFFDDLPEVKLKTLHVKTSTNANTKKVINTFAIFIEYGNSVTSVKNIPDFGNVEFSYRPCVQFLFSNGNFVARYKVVPMKGATSWEMYTKITGKDETYEGIVNRSTSPFTSKCSARVVSLEKN